MMWKRSVRHFASKILEPLGPQDAIDAYNHLLNAGAHFKHLPYARLRQGRKHRYGVLRLWPKLKSLKAGATTWAELKWRPLASYQQNRWSALFRLAAKWANFVVDLSGDGHAISNPRVMTELVLKYNEAYQERHARGDSYPLEQSLYDISNFFTFVSRDDLRIAIDWYVARLKVTHPGFDFF